MLPTAGGRCYWFVESFKNDITVVGGYRAAAIDPSGVKLTVNERYAETGELASLACALGDMQSDTVICYGDLLFRSYVLRDLLECEAEFAVVVDSSDPGAFNSTVHDFAYCSRSDDRDFFGSGALLGGSGVPGKRAARAHLGAAIPLGRRLMRTYGASKSRGLSVMAALRVA
jgi:phosphoenolpyruvate phosphomutase